MDDWIAKIIGSFLIIEDLLDSLPLSKQWIREGGILVHSPIFLEIKGFPKKLSSPFKLNSN